MPKGTVRKRCTECRWVGTGRAGKYETCEQCGAEMVVIVYRRPSRRRSRNG